LGFTLRTSSRAKLVFGRCAYSRPRYSFLPQQTTSIERFARLQEQIAVAYISDDVGRTTNSEAKIYGKRNSFYLWIATLGFDFARSDIEAEPPFSRRDEQPDGFAFHGPQGAMSRRNEASVFIDESQKHELLKGLFDNYYHLIHHEQLVFDTNRAWCSKLPTLVRLFPNSKVVCCVRHVPWIMDSLERLIRENAFELSGIFGFESLNTVYTRVNRLAMSEGLGGPALDARARIQIALSWSVTRLSQGIQKIR